MVQACLSFIRIHRVPTLAAALVLCMGFTANTIARAMTTPLDSATANAARPSAIIAEPALENGEVLTKDDATLYRSIFTALAHGYWKEAELMSAHLCDKRLMGHILAERYLHQSTTALPDLQTWLAAYHDLPEASDIYAQAQKLPGAKKIKLAHPTVVSSMSGHGYGYATSSGFRGREHTLIKAASVQTRHIVNEIEQNMRQGNPAKAKALIESSVQDGLLSQDALVSLQSRLAAGYFYNGDSTEALRLTEAAYMQGDARALWINGLSNYQLGHYATASTAFVTLANRDELADSDQAAAAFWAYRALKHSGSKDEAEQWLARAANQPHSFYGLLASNLSGQKSEAAWSWHLPDFNQQTAGVLGKIPAGGRALALLQIGQNELAERELARINPQGRRSLQDALLALTEKAHMASLAFKLGGMSVNEKGKPYDAALYPVPSWQPHEGYRVDRALMYALMRHESQFDPTAVSSQGACGLMQLMPATADRMSGKATRHVNGECPDQFFDPVTNVGLGQRYVKHLAEQPMIGDNLLLLLAAYNGGPGRLSQRAGTDDEADPLLFMESLPAQETHDYVQQVLIQYWTYRARLHQPLKSLEQLAHGEWPRFALRDTGGVREASVTGGFEIASNATVH